MILRVGTYFRDPKNYYTPVYFDERVPPKSNLHLLQIMFDVNANQICVDGQNDVSTICCCIMWHFV